MIANSILDAIGNTPLLKLGRTTEFNIYGKLEMLNPGGSIKDRVAKYLVLEAEKKEARYYEYDKEDACYHAYPISDGWFSFICRTKGGSILRAHPGSLLLAHRQMICQLGVKYDFTMIFNSGKLRSH